MGKSAAVNCGVGQRYREKGRQMRGFVIAEVMRQHEDSQQHGTEPNRSYRGIFQQLKIIRVRLHRQITTCCRKAVNMFLPVRAAAVIWELSDEPIKSYLLLFIEGVTAGIPEWAKVIITAVIAGMNVTKWKPVRLPPSAWQTN